MAQINISNLTFSYEGSYDNIFENVSFQIDTNWKLGFTGRNGRGKTTFMKLLMSKCEYTGTITSPVVFDYFPFEVSDKSRNTIEVIREIYDDFELWELLRELSLLEVSEDIIYQPFDYLSNGEQTKILIAALFLKDNSFLLIDEPTNHLDIEGRKKLSEYLKRKKGFILVSHDRGFLDNCIDHILSINKTNIEIQSGNFTTWWNNKENRDNYEINKNKKLQKDIKKLKEAAKRTSLWSDKIEKSKTGTGHVDKGYIGHKAAKMMKRSKSIDSRGEDAIEEKSRLLHDIEAKEDLSISPVKYFNNRLIDVNGVSVFYDEKKICDDISFNINKGDRIALTGKNGSGKSSVLKLLLGDKIVFTGDINIGSRLIISYVPQDTSFLKGDLKGYARDNSIDESLFKAILRKLDLKRVQFEKDMSDFSAGQKKKVLIAKSLCEKAHLYIWDEPLNCIDVISRMQIEELILKYEPTMIFVEHDISFVDEVGTKKVCL